MNSQENYQGNINLRQNLNNSHTNLFYRLSDPFGNKALRLSTKGYSDWVTDEFAFSLFKGLVTLSNPLKLGGFMGGKAYDFLFSGFVFIKLFSDRVNELLEENGITGWNTYPVEVFDRKGYPLPGYHGFSVTGKECRRDKSRSQILTKQVVPGGEPYDYYKGLYFFESDWDKNDIFLVQNNITVVTERVRNIFLKNKIRNVSLVPLSEVEIDVYLDKFD